MEALAGVAKLRFLSNQYQSLTRPANVLHSKALLQSDLVARFVFRSSRVRPFSGSVEHISKWN